MKAYSLDLRRKIIETDRTEMITRKGLAARFKVSESFVGNLLQLFRETGDVLPKPHGGGHPPRLNPEQLVSLIEIVESNNDATLDELSHLLEEKEQVFVPRSTMGDLMQRLDLNRKKKTLTPKKKHTDKVQKLRVEYWDVIRNVTADNLIFIDESGVNLAMIRLYARAYRGERARGDKPQKTKNVSIIGALSLKGMIASYNISGGVKAITFEAFICTKLVPLLWPGAYVIMDNAQAHKSARIEEEINSKGAHLVFLPPYSPDLSPIENYWSKLKTILRSIGARTYKKLDEAIKEAYSQVSLENIRNWFAHGCYCDSPFENEVENQCA